MDDLLFTQQEQIETLRERIRQLLDALAPPDVVVPIEWHLTSSEARVFAHLTTRDIATKSSIMAALYSDRIDGEEVEPKIVDVFVCKMRRKLAKFGVDIMTVWGTGYSLANRSTFMPKASSGTSDE